MTTKTIVPTPEQLEVIDASDPQLVVLASAGAGKTGTLVHRYLRHVHEGLRPDQILTITFTRKAAAEMKSRIVKALDNAGLKHEAQIAETGPIQTIHGFCERMLRENSVAAGIDPEFDVLGEGEMSRLFDVCVQAAVAEADNEYADRLISRMAGVGAYGVRGSHAQLSEIVREILTTMRDSGADFEALLNIYHDPSTIRFHWQSQLLAWLPEPVKEAFDSAEGEGVFDRTKGAYKSAGVRAPRWAATKVEASIDQMAAEDACGFMHLVCAAWAMVEQEMERRQSLDFSALESRAVRLLGASKACAERLRRQYRMVMVDEAQDINPMQYRLLRALNLGTEMLVGDPQQSIYGFRQADVELFKARANESQTKRLRKNWRSGDGILQFVDSLFGRMWKEYVPMRATDAPMDFDATDSASFEGVELWLQRAEDPTGVANYIKELHAEGEELSSIHVLVRGLRFGVQLQKALQDVGLASRIAGGSERFYTRLEICDLANMLVALANPYDDFALLATLRSPFCGLSLDSVSLLAVSVGELPAGVPVTSQVEENRNPLPQPLPPPRQTSSAQGAGAIRIWEKIPNFVPPLKEDAEKLAKFLEWFAPMTRYADRLPAWEVLSELYAVSGYLEVLAKRRNADQLLANVRKLLLLASQEPELGPVEYAERIREIQNFRHREGDAPAEDDQTPMVTIMTIHKAKGLEFETVVVPETHDFLERKNRPVEIDPKMLMMVPRGAKQSSPFYVWLADERKRRNNEEEERVLYVAMTRAKRKLCVVVHPNAKKVGCHARMVARQIGLDMAASAGAKVRNSQDQQPDE